MKPVEPHDLAARSTAQLTIALAAGFAALVAVTGGCPTAPAPARGPVPDRLLAVEGGAEDAYDKALVHDFAAVASAAETIRHDWTAYAPDARAAGAADATLTGMDGAVAALVAAPADGLAAGRAANTISSFMSDLFGLYAVQVPVAIVALDYLGRGCVLDALAEDATAAAADIETLHGTWNGVRAAVVDADGSDAALRYDAHVQALRDLNGARDFVQLAEQANVGLQLVDEMETLFE